MKYLNFTLPLCCLVSILWLCSIAEETAKSPEIHRFEVDDSTLFVLPEASKTVPGSYLIGDEELMIEHIDDRIKLEAKTQEGKSIVQWVSDSDPYARFLFNSESKKFERLSDSVRVVLNDYQELDELVENTDALSGKAFPALDYAIIQLPEDIHPAEYVKEIEAREEVEAATIVPEQPRQIPL